MAIEQQITQILKKELPTSQVEMERDLGTGKVGGRVIWSGFEGYTSLRRQNRIFGLLRRSHTSGDTKDISFIFTYTPAEYELLLAA